jgi:hypothetical protein
MVRDVAMEEELTCQVLAPPATAFRLEVQGFSRTDHFDVHTIGLRPDDRYFTGPSP